MRRHAWRGLAQRGALAHLRALRRVFHRGRRLRHGATLSQGVVERLRGTLGEVELVAKVGLALVGVVASLLFLLLDLARLRLRLVRLLLLLLLCLVRRRVQQIALCRVVERSLVHGGIRLEHLLLVGEADDRSRSLRIVRPEDLRQLLVEFLIRKLQLLARPNHEDRRLPIILGLNQALINFLVAIPCGHRRRGRRLGLGRLLLLGRHRAPRAVARLRVTLGRWWRPLLRSALVVNKSHNGGSMIAPITNAVGIVIN